MHLRAPIACILTLLCACGSPVAPTVEGTWGGTEASLTLTRAGGTLQYPCGAGTIDSGWTLSAAGRFAAAGQHFIGGGPVPIGGRTPHPAVYAGQVDGASLTLTVTLTDVGETLGPFHLIRGGPAVTEVCV